MNIFWLDDLHYRNRDLLEFFQESGLIKNITFAYDYESGKQELLKNSSYNIYILDADFAYSLSEERRIFLKDKIDNISHKETQLTKSAILDLIKTNTIDCCFFLFIHLF